MHRLAEAWMSAMFPCDLGDGIEVVHDVEVIEIEMDCDLGDDDGFSAPYERIEIRLEPLGVDTVPYALFEPDTLPFALG